MMHRFIYCSCALLLLAACDGGVDMRETLGIKHKAPDEFRVVSRPPLSVPPEFELRPPAAGESEHVFGTPARDQAKETVFGATPAPSSLELAPQGGTSTAVPVVLRNELATPAESQFLKNAGADTMQPNIRQVIAQDQFDATPEEEPGWWDKLTGKTLGSSKGEPTVNAAKEAERIKENKDAGKPVTEGDTPVIKPKDRGVLGELLK